MYFEDYIKKLPCSRTKRKCNNNGEINGHGQLELEGNNNFSSSNRNAVVVNTQQNNIISKIEVIDQNQQLIQLDNTCITFSRKATKYNTQLEDCEGTFPVTSFCLIYSIIALLQNPILKSGKKHNTS